MRIPQDYFSRVYAGWLGKVIGIRLGAPVEGWTYEKIVRVYGELTDYPMAFRNFAADDDSNGPIFFARALEDCRDLTAFSAQDVGEALLNYAPYEHGFFWWGGYGVSTEHTAYLNLRAGIPAPSSRPAMARRSSPPRESAGVVGAESDIRRPAEGSGGCHRPPRCSCPRARRRWRWPRTGRAAGPCPAASSARRGIRGRASR